MIATLYICSKTVAESPFMEDAKVMKLSTVPRYDAELGTHCRPSGGSSAPIMRYAANSIEVLYICTHIEYPNNMITIG